MRSLASTTAQFGGFVFQTDNDQHPILDKLYRLLDVWTLVGIQINILLMRLDKSLNSFDVLCSRSLTWMDAAESLAEGVMQAMGVVGETWQTLTFNRLGYAPG